MSISKLFQAIYEIQMNSGKTVEKKSATFHAKTKDQAKLRAHDMLRSLKAKNIKVYEK